MHDIHIMVSRFGGPLKASLTHAGPSTDEYSFALHFTLEGTFQRAGSTTHLLIS
jgi:hypothetical protein